MATPLKQKAGTTLVFGGNPDYAITGFFIKSAEHDTSVDLVEARDFENNVLAVAFSNPTEQLVFQGYMSADLFADFSALAAGVTLTPLGVDGPSYSVISSKVIEANTDFVQLQLTVKRWIANSIG